MSTFQYDELLTEPQILARQTLPPVKEADQHAEAAPEERISGTAH
jgi:hypothetical protein